MDIMSLADYGKLKQNLAKKLKGYRAIVLYCQALVDDGELLTNELITDEGLQLKRCPISGNLNDAMQTMLKTSIEYDAQIIFTITPSQHDLYSEIKKTGVIPCFKMEHIPSMYRHNKYT